MLNSIKTKINGGIFRNRMDINRSYLLELDPQCLLQNFYLEAGIIMPGLQVISNPDDANLHWGWESPACQLRGHFLGHWLSAAARLISAENNEVLKQRLDYIISELSKCQERNGGEWVGSIPEKYFDWMCGNDYIWSPQYTMHKTLMGLVDAYRFADNKQALEIAGKLSDWYLVWTSRHPEGIFKGEQGGMLEEWAELFAITGEDKYKELISRYQDNYIYNKLENEEDALTDDHANASIPNSHGSARLYEITGDEKWKNLTELFWKHAVTIRGMYPTTGQNAGEFWIPPFKQHQYICDRDQEFCTVYNMVRTADFLFRWTKDVKYADYIERALYNGFLAQQNQQTGMPTYFLPMGMGSTKKWGSKRHDFWCCHGTMVQAQTIYPWLTAYSDEKNNELLIAQYITSEFSEKVGGANVKVSLSADMSDHNNQVFFAEHSSTEKSMWSFGLNVECDKPCTFTLSLRIPVWAEEYVIFCDGKEISEKAENGFVKIKKEWSGQSLIIRFKSRLYEEPLADAPEVSAILDGPVVLAGLIESDNGLYGNLDECLAPNTEHLYSYIPWKQNCYVTRGQKRNFKFVPLYDVTDEVYTLYFTRK